MAAPPDDADAYAVMRAIGAAVAEARAGGDPGEVGWVVELLGSADDWVAASAAEATGPLGLRQAIPQLVRLLASGPDAPPEAITSGEQAYALAAVALEGVDVRLGAARSLGRLVQPGDTEARAALEAAARHGQEHESVRAAARAALFADGSEGALSEARDRMVALSARIETHAALITMAKEYGHRMSDQDRARAVAALGEANRDRVSLAALVRWALGRHRAEMLAWADAAAELALSDAYQEGWVQTRRWWVASPEVPDGGDAEPPPALSWLITMWAGARAGAAGRSE